MSKNNKKSKKRKKKLSPVIWLLLIIILLYVITEIAPVILERTVQTVIVKHEKLTVEEDVQCYALRSENVYAAPDNGTLEYKVENGELVKVGARVADFHSTTDDFSGEVEPYKELIQRADIPHRDNIENAGKKGIFTTNLDGNEKFFTMKNYKNITETKAKERSQDTVDVKTKKVGKGQPIYKITDQSSIGLVCWVRSGSISKYRKNDVVEVQFDEDTNVKFTITRIDKEGSKWKLLLETNRYFNQFADFRCKDVKIISSDMEGLKIPNSCITTENGIVGVYVGDKSGDFDFIPVKIITSDGKHSIIKSNIYYDKDGKLINTVRIYDEILRKPKTKTVEK